MKKRRKGFFILLLAVAMALLLLSGGAYANKPGGTDNNHPGQVDAAVALAGNIEALGTADKAGPSGSDRAQNKLMYKEMAVVSLAAPDEGSGEVKQALAAPGAQCKESNYIYENTQILRSAAAILQNEQATAANVPLYNTLLAACRGAPNGPGALASSALASS